MRWHFSLVLLFFSGIVVHGDKHFVSLFEADRPVAYYVKFLKSRPSNHCVILSEQESPKYAQQFQTSEEDLHISSTSPAVKSVDLNERQDDEGDTIFEIFARNKATLEAYLTKTCGVKNGRTSSDAVDLEEEEPIPSPYQDVNPEIVKVVDGGNQGNRIDVVFMGDGYTLEERTKFFEDIDRITKEMFEGVTFKSYLPLFNIWAIYIPSNESGIGYDGPKATPFRLYRERGQLRVVYTGAANYARQVCALTGTSGCDYPSIIGNDDFYGGVGGEFVISTRALRTGPFVLRHEMGHNFVAVGDEYDNSWAYYGANSAKNLSSIPWSHWLTDPPPLVAPERATYRLLEYPWADLASQQLHSFPFTSNGAYNRWFLTLSVSAAGERDSLEFLLDGVPLPWTSSGYDDREFYEWYGNQGFSLGGHVFSVRAKTPSTHPFIPRMICSVQLYEWGSESEFHSNSSIISAYPTWDDSSPTRGVTLRPTNSGCLMRNITSDSFCPICKESMWLQFLERISLVDNTSLDNVTDTLTLNTLQLGHFRRPENQIEGESLATKWYLQEVHRPELDNAFVIANFTSSYPPPGEWRVEVEFTTDEVRSDPKGLLKESYSFRTTTKM